MHDAVSAAATIFPNMSVHYTVLEVEQPQFDSYPNSIHKEMSQDTELKFL